LIGDSWETVLQRYIPKFEANKNVLDYQLTVRELMTEMHDSHGGVRNAKAAEEWLGDFTPPIIVDFIEDHTVVTKVLDDKSSLKVGDALLTMDGQPIEKRVGVSIALSLGVDSAMADENCSCSYAVWPKGQHSQVECKGHQWRHTRC
jgi:hypothetical protein